MSFICPQPLTGSNKASAEDPNALIEGAEITCDKPHDIVQQQYDYWISSPTWLRYLFGSLEFQRRHFRRKNCKSLETKYYLPRWFSSKAFQIASYSTPIDWNIKIKTYRIIPLDAPIWQLIRVDDVAGVRDMLIKGEALLTDRSTYSLTLLSVRLISVSRESL